KTSTHPSELRPRRRGGAEVDVPPARAGPRTFLSPGAGFGEQRCQRTGTRPGEGIPQHPYGDGGAGAWNERRRATAAARRAGWMTLWVKDEGRPTGFSRRGAAQRIFGAP